VPVLDAVVVTRQPAPVSEPPEFPRRVLVEMDEFHSVTPGSALLTLGVSTCTAVVVAPHISSAHGVIHRLLEAGLFLSQITFVDDPGARRADVMHDPAAGTTWMRWYAPDGGDHWIDAAEVPDRGRHSQQALDYREAVRRADTAAGGVHP